MLPESPLHGPDPPTLLDRDSPAQKVRSEVKVLNDECDLRHASVVTTGIFAHFGLAVVTTLFSSTPQPATTPFTPTRSSKEFVAVQRQIGLTNLLKMIVRDRIAIAMSASYSCVR